MAGVLARPDSNERPDRSFADYRFESVCRPKRQMARTGTSRLLTLLLLAACVLIALQSIAHAAPRRARKAECPNAQLQPAPGNLAAVRAAVLCLHNRARAARGLPRLDPNPRLREAATKHSEHMVAAGFFAHVTPDGADIGDRIARTGYGGDGALGYGFTVGDSVPAAVVGASTTDPGVAFSDGEAEFEIAYPEATVRTQSHVRVDSTAEAYTVTIELTASEDGTERLTRRWDRVFPRDGQ